MKLGVTSLGVLKLQHKAFSNKLRDSKYGISKETFKMRLQSSVLEWTAEVRDLQVRLSGVS